MTASSRRTVAARVVSVALAGVSLVTLAGVLTRPKAAPAPASDAVAVAPPPATEPAATPPAPVRPSTPDAPAPGSRRTYQVQFTQTVLLAAEVTSDAGAGQSSALIKGLEGSLTLTCVSSASARLRYRGLLEDVRASANGQPYPAGHLLEDFGRPFFLETDGDGKVVSVAFEEAAGTDARRSLKALLASSQVVLPRGTSDAWTTQEEDPTGEYEARYAREGDARHVRKERTKYLRIATEDGLRPASEQGEIRVHDSTQVELLASGAVERIASETETDLQFGRGMPRVHLTSVLSLSLQKADVDTSDLQAMNDAWQRAQKVVMASPPMQDDPNGKQDAERKADQKLLQHANLQSLERELAATPKTSPRERAVAMAKLRADFRLHPDDAQKIVSYVRTASVADGQAVAGALGGTGTPEALRALVEIANTTEAPLPVRANAIGALAISPTPSPDTVQALKTMTGDADADISKASTLALGAAAAGVRITDPSTYEDAVAMLLADLAAAQTPQETILYLRALGNSGDSRVLAAAQQVMSSGDPSVRAAAVAAVRFVPGPDVDAFLVDAMQNDADAVVRVQAVDTAEQYRVAAPYVPTFGQLSQADASPLVRRAALHALNVVKAIPAAMGFIAAAAQNDPSPSVREYARAILESV